MRTAFFGTHGGFTRKNEERVPQTGPLIVAPVHISYLDPPAIACGTRRRLRFMAKEDLFRVKILGPLIHTLGAFPVRRGENDTEAIRRAMSLLEEGEAILIFPEGTRNDGKTMGHLNRGIAMMAKRTNARVIPVGIIGTNVVMPRGKKKSAKHLVTIAWGHSFTYDEVGTSSSERENRDLFTAELEKRIQAVCAENGMVLKTAELPTRPQKSVDSGTASSSPTT